MGLFDAIKSAASSLTGGGATISLLPDPLSFDAAFQIRVQAVIGNADIQARGLYLHVEGTEDVQVPNVTVQQGSSTTSRTVHASNMTVRMEYPVAEGQVFQAGRTYDWTVEVKLPDGASPLYNGKLARHYYRAKAGIDTFGNDPDSGWEELQA